MTLRLRSNNRPGARSGIFSAGRLQAAARIFLALLLLHANLGVPAATAQDTGAGADGRSIRMDFNGVDLPVFIKFISELTGKNFVLDASVRGKVTVLSPTPVTVEEAYEIFESVLQVQGFIAVPAGSVTKILPAIATATSGLPTRADAQGQEGVTDEVVTQVLPLKYAQAEEALKMLKPMVSKNGLITVYGPTDTIIVTDSRSNIRRLQEVVQALDVRDTEQRIEHLRLRYADAEETASQLAKVMQAAKNGGARTVQIVPDKRLNALIVMGEPQDLEEMRRLMRQVDQPAAVQQGDIRVYKLSYADAEELASVLNGLVGKAPSARPGGQSGPEGGAAGKAPAVGLAPGSSGASSGGSSGGSSQEAEAVIDEDVSIIPDKPTNSLVIISGGRDYERLEKIIQQLDQPRKQVMVEALIMEVSSDKTVAFGTQFLGGFSTDAGPDGAIVGGYSNPGGTGASLSNPGPGMGLGAQSFPVTIGGVTLTNLNALVTFGRNNGDFNIVSTPQVMTLDNQEATIVVADNRPFQTSENVGRNVDDLTVRQFTYRDVGTTLKITPHVNDGGIIKLNIFQEFSEIDEGASTSTGALLPVTRKRSTETVVLAREGETIVLSGLIGKTTSKNFTGVPGLSSVPLFGWLFKTKRQSERKTNLLVFITPHVLENPSEARELTLNKVREFETIQYDEADRIPPRPMGLLASPLSPQEVLPQ